MLDGDKDDRGSARKEKKKKRRRSRTSGLNGKDLTFTVKSILIVAEED